MQEEPHHIYLFGPFRLDLAQQQLRRDDEPVALTPKAFDLLIALVEGSGRLLTKEELLRRVWPDSFVEEANLSVKMSELRRALGESPQEARFIETVPRRGYRFVADVRREEPDAGKTRAQVEDAAPRDTAGEHTGRRWYAWGIGIGAVVLLGLLVLGFNAGGLRDRFFALPASVEIKSVAVLPFVNLSGDASQEYLADGLTESIINDLAKRPGVTITSPSVASQYKGALKPVADIARELQVAAVLTGSVLRSGDRVQFTVRLSDAKDRSIWSESYERPVNDLFALQKQVTRDLVRKLKLNAPNDQAAGDNAGTVDAEAFDHYLRGKYYFHRQTASENAAAISAFESAVAADPNFAAAHAELAQAYVWKLFLFSPSEKNLAEKAFVESEKALSLDPDSAVAYLARGRLLWTPANRFPHDEAIREYKRALELDPNLDEARNQLALVYSHIGAFEPALAQLRLALAANPGNSLARFRVGETLLFQGKYDEALTAFRDTPADANPALVGHQTVWALLHLGRDAEASAMLDRYLKDNPEDNRGLFTSQLAVMAARAGRRSEAEEKIKLAIRNGKGFGHFHHTAFHIACAYALLGNKEEAFRWIEDAANDGFPVFPMFESEVYLANIRELPRFRELMERLKQRWGGYQTSG